MRNELVDFVIENNLSPFSQSKSTARTSKESIFKTPDAKKIHTKLLTKLSGHFTFSETSLLWNCFETNSSIGDIRMRQDFFSKLKKTSRNFLKSLNKPRATWKPKYDVVVVTEDESTFVKLNELGCGVILLSNQNDVADLERYDIVQVVDCTDFTSILEKLPQSVFLSSPEDAYLERFLEELSGWRENFAVLNGADVSKDLRECLDQLIESFMLLENKEGKIISEGMVESALEEINEEVGEKIKEMTISGEGLMKMLGEGKIPEGILKVIQDSIQRSEIPEHIFNIAIPVTIDYKELEAQIKIQSAHEFTSLAERIKRNASKLKSIPSILRELKAQIIVEDFLSGIAEYIDSQIKFPADDSALLLEDCKNLFLKDAQPISFILDMETKCSILTGANSGGKTTLLEHILQNITLFKMGLPISGNFKSPVFDEVYYFAKTSGSTSKGAFETLLSQMAGITFADNKKILILADEIEAVTEPGIAGKIIGTTAEYFIEKGCFVVLATHLGTEIAKALPKGARVDGIEATGLDEDFNLIVNHNPVLGRLASSTPELIVERLAKSSKEEYFGFLFDKIKKSQ